MTTGSTKTVAATRTTCTHYSYYCLHHRPPRQLSFSSLRRRVRSFMCSCFVAYHFYVALRIMLTLSLRAKAKLHCDCCRCRCRCRCCDCTQTLEMLVIRAAVFLGCGAAAVGADFYFAWNEHSHLQMSVDAIHYTAIVRRARLPRTISRVVVESRDVVGQKRLFSS